MTFSDDSDVEDPKAGLTPAATRKISCAQKVLPLKSTGSQASSQGLGSQSSGAQPRRGRPGTRRAGAVEEKRERVTRRAPGKRAEEEWELLRAIEEEKVEEELEISLEVLQVSDEEEGAPGELGYPRDWGVWGGSGLAFMHLPMGGDSPVPPVPGASVPPRRQETAAPAQAEGCRWEAQSPAARGW